MRDKDIIFNENARVKIPAILHLMRLGFTYLSLSEGEPCDKETNIFTGIFQRSIARINPGMKEDEIRRLHSEVSLALNNEDLGQAFYRMLTATSEPKLIDFTDFARNNSFHVVAELTCRNGDEWFRPDITLLVNGMPLAFIEVKKPSNKDGVIEEGRRMKKRFLNKKFRKFINITQLMVFSNNMEYDPEATEPRHGAYYATTSYSNLSFNYFREEKDYASFSLLPEKEEDEWRVLTDTNLTSIRHSSEFRTNKNTTTPTNRLLTSLFSFHRLEMLLRFGIAYVKGEYGLEKHIMRYPQLFATQAIEETLEAKLKKGIIWHTQGSGKTALAYFNVHYLTEYYRKKGIVPKFYFIVDRLDLMTQANSEFTNRGLVVNKVDSRKEFVADMKKQAVIHNLSGCPEITVVNIQKFSDDSVAEVSQDYNLNVQRIYFLDEVHRSYNPNGCFLGNLLNSDRNAVLIGLTGTPRITGGFYSKELFGEYIHTYYYDQSIADGYTLRLMREEIETSYKLQLREALNQIKVLKGTFSNKAFYAHRNFVYPMLEYILNDFRESREGLEDPTIGGMIVCASTEQARMMYQLFDEVQEGESAHLKLGEPSTSYQVAEPMHSYGKRKLKVALILDGEGSKEDQRKWRDQFKAGEIDFLIVYNMLLTGFDARRLKKLYLGRIVKDHSLLQTLTRVNRPYNKFKYGYVVDFADIRAEFDKANKAYFEELQKELGNEIESYKKLFKSAEEIEQELEDIREKLFLFNLDDAEVFLQQVHAIQDKEELRELKKALQQARELYNQIRLLQYDGLQNKLDFPKINYMYRGVADWLAEVNKKDRLEHSGAVSDLLEIAMEDIVFLFAKIGKEELKLAGDLRNILQQTRQTFLENFDPQDPEFISLHEELERMFKQKKFDEVTQEAMNENIRSLKSIYQAITDLNRRNGLLRDKYKGDEKFVRVHKRTLERKYTDLRREKLHAALTGIKSWADRQIYLNSRFLQSEGVFEDEMIKTVIETFEEQKIGLDSTAAEFINRSVVREYLNEYQYITR